MRYSPVVAGPYWNPPGVEKYIGPPHARGREALLAKHRRTVAIIRDPQGPRNHRLNPVRLWERRWLGTADGRLLGCMTLLGVEGVIYKQWRRLRDRWLDAGCPKGLTPWAVWGLAEQLSEKC